MSEEAALTKKMNKKQKMHNIEEVYLGGATYDERRLWDEIDYAIVSIQDNYYKMGLKFLAIKEMKGHGDFKNEIQRRYADKEILSYRTIAKTMQVAKFFLDNPKLTKAQGFKQLSKGKLLALASATEDDVDEDAGTVFGLTLEDARALKIKDLQARIQAQDKKLEKQAAEIDKGREQLLTAREEVDKLKNKHRVVGQAVDELHAEARLEENTKIIEGCLIEIANTWEKDNVTPRVAALIRAAATQVFHLTSHYTEVIRCKLDDSAVPSDEALDEILEQAGIITK